jgi:hypothetical protein
MATAQLPSSVGLPSEMKYNLDYSMPPESKSYSIRIQPSNVSQVTTSFSTGIGPTTYWGDMAMPASNIIFDIPCGSSPSLFLDQLTTWPICDRWDSVLLRISGTKIMTVTKVQIG